MDTTLPMFSFTKEDNELVKGQSLRDPLGTQVIWSAAGRHIVPHLTEQTNSVLGFQLLLSSFYFHDKYSARIDTKFEEYKERLAQKNARHTFSLENVFILLEQAFAFSYHAVNGDWPLNGKRQVIAFRDDPRLSLKRQILSSQLGTGVWGYYRGAAIRSGLLDASGRRLVDHVRAALDEDGVHVHLLRRKIFSIITDALLEDSVEFHHRPSNPIIRHFANILESIPQKKMLQEHLLTPKGDPLVRSLAEFAVYHKLFDQDEDSWREFFNSCMGQFPDRAEDFRNIVRCTDYIGSMDALFEWLLNFKGKPVRLASKQCPLDLETLRKAQQEFGKVLTFPLGIAHQRAKMFVEEIDLDSPLSLITSLIAVHTKIADSRGALKWISISDAGKLLVETDPFTQSDAPLGVSPGRGWRYDYYMTPLMNIFRGLK